MPQAQRKELGRPQVKHVRPAGGWASPRGSSAGCAGCDGGGGFGAADDRESRVVDLRPGSHDILASVGRPSDRE